jgi:hypothetical protein
MEDTMFSYYTVTDSEQIRFYQLPRELVKHEKFKSLSDSAKILYALLRDRVSLSVKNNWVDDLGRVYIIFPLSEIMEDLGCADQKATKSMKELQKMGLIENIRRGLGKPNIIFVKNFASGLNGDDESHTSPINSLNRENHESRISKITNQESRKSRIKTRENHEQSIRTLSLTDLNDTESSQSHVIEESLQETPEKTKTDMTLTMTPDKSVNKVADNKKAPPNKPVREHEQGEANKYTENYYNNYKAIIQENIDYVNFTHSQSDIELVDGIIETMLDVICTESPSTIKMGNEVKSRDIVRSIYLKLKYDHIVHVIDQYKAQHHQITHKGAYMRKMLYMVFQELDAYYTNQVRADGVVW